MKKSVQVCFSPKLYSLFHQEESVVVVADIFRATTAIVTAFEHGAKTMISVATPDEAMVLRNEGYLIAGERNAIKLDGFDFGNSPLSYTPDVVFGRNIAITTTNGTQAILAAKHATGVLIGAFSNLSVIVRQLNSLKKDVIVLCAGWKNRFNMEDALFAGALTEALLEYELFETHCDSAMASLDLWHIAMHDPESYLEKSSHRHRLSHLNLSEDIHYCLQLDSCTAIPILHGKELVEIKTLF